jgi:hypothetical protein
MHVCFNFQFDPAGRLRKEERFAVAELLEYRNNGLDFAIVRLEGFPGDRYGYARISEREALEGEMLCIIQHPEGLPKRIDAGPLFHVNGDLMGYDTIDTMGGSSGAGILSGLTGMLVGLHTHGGCDDKAIGHNHGLRIGAIIRNSPTIRNLLLSGWECENLSLKAGAPKATGGLSGFLQSDGKRLHLSFCARGNRLHRLTFDGKWTYSSPGADVKAPSMSGACKRFRPQRSTALVFPGARRGIAPVDGSRPLAEAEPDGPDPQSFSRRKPHRLSRPHGPDRLCRLPGRRRPPAPGSLPREVVPRRLPHCRYRALPLPAAIRRFAWTRRAANDISSIQPATGTSTTCVGTANGITGQSPNLRDFPKLKGDPAAVAGKQLWIAWRGAKGRIYLLEGGDQWRLTDLMKTGNFPAAKDDPWLFLPPNSEKPEILYRDAKGHIFRLWWDAAWKIEDLSSSAGAPPARERPVGLYFPLDKSRRVVFRARDNYLYKLRPK